MIFQSILHLLMAKEAIARKRKHLISQNAIIFLYYICLENKIRIKDRILIHCTHFIPYLFLISSSLA